MQPYEIIIPSQILIWVFEPDAVQEATRMTDELYPGRTYTFYYLNLETETAEERVIDQSVQINGIWNRRTTFAEESIDIIDKGIFNIPPIDDLIPTNGLKPTTTVSCTYTCTIPLWKPSYFSSFFFSAGVQDTNMFRICQISCQLDRGQRDS
jgi:hypothetical protein